MNPSEDGSLRALYVAQWVRPALVPVLEACLDVGDMFVDVGANVGIYATWAAKIVGVTGRVLAVEPAPQARRWLNDICQQNELSQVEVLSSAAGEEEGHAWIEITQGASGLSRLTAGLAGGVEVAVTTVDNIVGSGIPALVKIDVEGHELSVLKGARRTLEATGSPVVFEAPDFGRGSGTVECVRLLESFGYRSYSLTTGGLRAFDDGDYSHNILAIRPDDIRLEHRLRRVRFPRSQNT